jgi:hypothetical protein
MLDKKTDEGQAFVLNNSVKLYSLRDLLNALSNMPEYVLNHHIMQGRNDFSNWIGDVFKYDDVAEDIKNAKNKEEIINVLKQYE